FPIVVAFLKSNWHTGMLLGLFNCLILYWRSIPVKHSILLREQLKIIISEYSGKRNDLLTIQRNISFYSEQYGPSTCAGTMAGNREFPSKLFDNYGLPKLYKHSEFCSCFISEYTKTACRNADFEIFIDEIALFLADFQDKSTCQLCFAYLAIRADNNTSEVFKQRILTHAVRIAGDPAKASKWLPSPMFSEQEKKSFEDGALILNRWISLKFIDLFFEKVSMDKDRKKFWQKYYKSIDKIKILGDEQLKLKFMRDERVRDYIDSRFGMLSYGCSVLLMQAKEHVFVEFGGTGNAFYAYKRNARKCPKFDAGNYSIYDLKDTTMSYLNNSLSQGRLVHRNGWQLELSQWLALHAGIRND
ncbi:MAG: hypothetical protein GX660_02355, partial [Clostridiaceae bacterium]|nr:hypothetical protein [Clostridiaceae bacterium]